MRDIKLLIRHQEVDLENIGKFIQNFNITMSFSDLENPASIADEYSYTVDLPGTAKNSAIFGHIDDSVSDYLSEDFNPSEPLNYMLLVDGNVFRTGSCRLTGVTIKNGKRNFKLIFYGNLSRLFYRLKNSEMRDLRVFQDSSLYHKLDRLTMTYLWYHAHDLSDWLAYVPTAQGKYPNFQSGKMLTAVPDESAGHGEWRYEVRDLPGDLAEYQKSEYRVQFQRPALKVSKLLDAIASENNITLSEGFFTKANPYYQESWLICPQYSSEESISNSSGKVRGKVVAHNLMTTTETIDMKIDQVSGDSSVFSEDVYMGENPYTLTLEMLVGLNATISPEDVSTYVQHGAIWNSYLTPPMDGYIDVSCCITDGMRTLYAENDVKLRGTAITSLGTTYHKWAQTAPNSQMFEYINPELDNLFPGYSNVKYTPCRFTFNIPPEYAGGSFVPQVKMSGIYAGFSFSSVGTIPYFNAQYMAINVRPIEELDVYDIGRVQAAGFTGVSASYDSNRAVRSGNSVNVRDMLQESITQGDFLLNYTKMFGCIWDSDVFGNVTVKSRNEFFNGFEILDWTDKLDRSQDLTLDPLTFDKYVYSMKYKDGGSYLEEEYRTKFGFEFGEKRVYPGYSFSSDEQEMLEKLPFSNTVMGKKTRYYLDCSTLVPGNAESYRLPWIEKDDAGSASGGYRLAFYAGVQQLSEKTSVYITEDSSVMYDASYGGAMWMDTVTDLGWLPNRKVRCPNVPTYDTRLGDCSFDFAKSKCSYDFETDYTYPPEIAVYPRFWANYISEIYGVSNRKLTAYFRLTTRDIYAFSFRNFVSIGNTLWHPVKLEQVSPLGDKLTKVELVEVTDIDAYVSGQILPGTSRRGVPVQTYDMRRFEFDPSTGGIKQIADEA